MGTVVALWRHPIKSHGYEALQEVALAEGKTMPWDRTWAVTYDGSTFDPAAPKWTPCNNFMRVTSTPSLAAIGAEYDEATGFLTLTHPAIGSHRFAPGNPDATQGFLDWITPLYPADRRLPSGLVTAPETGMTDSPEPHISILSTASNAACASASGRALAQERWRGNIWLDGLEPWEEEGWIGKTLRIGEVELQVDEPIGRCKATMANPQTGERDADTLSALRSLRGHQEFGLYARVIKPGTIKLGDGAQVL